MGGRRSVMMRSWTTLIVLVLFGAGALAGQGRIGRGGSPPNFDNAISGRVTDRGGQPIANAFVTLLQDHRSLYGNTRVGIVAANFGTTTDADGRYSLANLGPGEFYLVAVPPLNARPTSNAGSRLTFFPASADETSATKLTVAFGKKIAADIALLPATLATVSGVVLGPDEKPVAGGQLRIARGNGLFGVASAAAQIRPGGQFVLPGLPPGTYFLNYNAGAPRPVPGTEWSPSWETVVVSGRDLPNVRVAPAHAVRIAGKLIVDEETRQAVRAGTISVVTMPFDVSHDGFPGPLPKGSVNADLTFETYAWSSLTRLRVFASNGELRLTAARLAGKNVLEPGLVVTKGQPIAGVEIEVSLKNRIR